MWLQQASLVHANDLPKLDEIATLFHVHIIEFMVYIVCKPLQEKSDFERVSLLVVAMLIF